MQFQDENEWRMTLLLFHFGDGEGLVTPWRKGVPLSNKRLRIRSQIQELESFSRRMIWNSFILWNIQPREIFQCINTPPFYVWFSVGRVFSRNERTNERHEEGKIYPRRSKDVYFSIVFTLCFLFDTRKKGRKWTDRTKGRLKNPNVRKIQNETSLNIFKHRINVFSGKSIFKFG